MRRGIPSGSGPEWWTGLKGVQPPEKGAGTEQSLGHSWSLTQEYGWLRKIRER